MHTTTNQRPPTIRRHIYIRTYYIYMYAVDDSATEALGSDITPPFPAAQILCRLRLDSAPAALPPHFQTYIHAYTYIHPQQATNQITSSCQHQSTHMYPTGRANGYRHLAYAGTARQEYARGRVVGCGVRGAGLGLGHVSGVVWT